MCLGIRKENTVGIGRFLSDQIDKSKVGRSRNFYQIRFLA